jgi:hypothetical protein
MTEEHLVEPKQLDFFVDGLDAMLIHEVVTSLVARDPDRVAAGLARLRDDHPSHPDLHALTLLADSLLALPSAPATHAGLTASVETMERELTPAARRFLGTESATFLRPLWQTLAATAASLPFDEIHPRAHAGWLCQQYDDWAAVRVAIEAEPDWAAKPLLRCWMGLARHHLGEPEIAIRLWLPLCWMDPALFARHAPMLPSTVVREGWDAFERAGDSDDFSGDTLNAASWFPAWLLLRHRGLARLFRADDIPDSSVAARAFGAMLELVPLEGRGLGDELIARRRALRQLSPGFFRWYMNVVGGRSRIFSAKPS